MRKKFKSKYRMIALLLCILLIGGMFPLGVFASEDPVISSVSEEVFDEKDTGNAGQKDGDEKPSQRNATEEPKDEGLKAEEPKAGEPKAEEPKAGEPKAEEPKAEDPKTEESKAEESKVVELNAEEPKDGEPKTEEPKAEEPKAEGPKAEEPQAEMPKTEVANVKELERGSRAVSALGQLPARGAKAYAQGQTCPDCGTGILILIATNSEQHALSCSKTGCIHSTSAGYIWEDHHGGNACTGKPICEGCGQEYGSVLGHDWQTAWTIDGDVHYHACSKCSERKNEAAHSYVWTYVDDDTCKGVCECGAEITEAHYDRWASYCGRQPHCEKCDHDYGSIPEHDMYYEDRGESGHKPNCRNCDTYFFLEAHSGGTATCESAPICEKCGHEYGSSLGGHNWDTEWSYDENGHYHKCLNDGCTEKKDEAAHTGGTATCLKGRICDECGQEYGNPDTENGHKWDTEWSYDENGHYHKCLNDGCTAKKDEAAHSGGKATCTEKAVCEVCGQEYGAPLSHDLIDHDAQAPTCTAIGWDAYQTCSRCDYTTYMEKPASGHTEVVDAAVEPTCTEPGKTEGKHCSVCEAVLVAQKDVPAKGHVAGDPVRENETAAGYDEVVYCTACEAELNRTHVANKGVLIFDLGGGTLDGKTGIITIEANVGDTIKLLGAPSREGYTFQYWKGSEYKAGAEYKVEGDHTFTAVWEENKARPSTSSSGSSSPSGTSAAKTGDNSQIGLWLMLLAASMISLIMIFVRRGRFMRN